jgi:ferrochelatase
MKTPGMRPRPTNLGTHHGRKGVRRRRKYAMRFETEPPYRHGSSPRTAVLLCNLGTPDAPTAPALRRYLAEFLSDQRVVEIPPLLWWPILHGIILRVRPKRSAAKYASIWTPEGSPLLRWTLRQAQGLAQRLGPHVQVRAAMRYGNPSVASQLEALRAEGVTRVLVLPAYPQYSGTTTASVADAVYQWAGRARWVPELRFVNAYHDHPAYIDALAQRVQTHWAAHGRKAHLIMSFHGVPARTLEQGDPYHCQCHKTARLLSERLGLARADYTVTFQSRFGKAKWLEPYTEPTLVRMAQEGRTSVEVFCPGFTSDCLETLEEIAMEVQAAFREAGGTDFAYIDALNDAPAWLDALAAVATQHMQGWPANGHDDTSPEARAAQREAALTMGASN